MSTNAPRENLYRAQPVGVELRSEEDGTGAAPKLFGHFTPFNEWAEINSLHEGHFMERTIKGAFKNTFVKHRSDMKVMFEHGNDPSIGSKPIASIRTLREDDQGAYYEGDLLDTSYVRDLIPGLEAGVYGASYKFRVMKEEWVDEPERSETNPEGLPERTITEAHVMEFGPVVWGAYAGASSGLRSITDEVILGRAAHTDPGRLAAVIESALKRETPEPNPPETPEPTTPPAVPKPEPVKSMAVARSTPKESEEGRTMAVDIERFATIDDLAARQDEVETRLEQIVTEFGARAFTSEARSEYDELKEEKEAIAERMVDVQDRLDTIASAPPERKLKVVPEQRGGRKPPVRPDNVFDTTWYRQNARDPEHEHMLLRDGARSVIETATFPHEGANREDTQAHLERLLLQGDNDEGTVARHILATGSERYRRAFGKYLAGQERSNEEQRALSLAAASGGYAVPYTLDPTIIPTSNLAVNPFRAISRVEQIPGDQWQGVSSAGITAAYAAEATETTDNAPTLGNPIISTEKAQAFVPFSIEIGMDWGSLQTEMAGLLQDAKDELEATKFATGTGTNEPQGVIVGATTTTTAGGTAAFAVADLYALEAALGARFRPRASLVMNRFVAQKIRQFDTQGGANLWIDNLQLGLDNQVPSPGNYGSRVLGYPAFESSAMAAVLTTASKIAILGDFRYYLIVDRIGLSVEVIPHLVGTNHRPTGQRGLYAYWRNGAGVLSANAFRVLVTG